MGAVTGLSLLAGVTCFMGDHRDETPQSPQTKSSDAGYSTVTKVGAAVGVAGGLAGLYTYYKNKTPDSASQDSSAPSKKSATRRSRTVTKGTESFMTGKTIVILIASLLAILVIVCVIFLRKAEEGRRLSVDLEMGPE